ncbi:hypothetical protein ACFOZ0_33875 [Streptomyces yaanensis]|uniref:Peptidoglycan binding-like domain-containing protein n=1 Tax=Streptomyces yaanensis TaxID=1142239 RepID=A0ABV7SPZ1_9ACTN|nr:hypothetical protein [Streptomyces sp. CGMCC 4.7035]WNC03364.1 hypothetical protein Q2K21_21685 [Streptomyces sp. CGMCC 4.7035]
MPYGLPPRWRPVRRSQRHHHNAAGAAAPALVVDGNFGVLTQAAVHTFRAGAILIPGDDIDTPVWFQSSASVGGSVSGGGT